MTASSTSYNRRNISILALIFFGLMPAQLGAVSVFYQSGHGDIGLRYEDGEFSPLFRYESAVIDGNLLTNGELEPGDLTIEVSSEAMLVPTVDVPFLGALAGTPIWMLPASQIPGIPYLGWSTEALKPADWIGNITFTLARATVASGHGNFASWQYDAFGEVSEITMSTAQPGLATGLAMVPGTHDHLNLAFTSPGVWELQLRVSGRHATDGVIETTLPAWTFHVIPEPSACACFAASVVLMLGQRRRRFV